jgi:hypothetical protein
MESPLDEKKVAGLDPLSLLGHSLSLSLKSVIANRSVIERRWIEDLQQYIGEYDPSTLKAMEDNKQSSVFLNITRIMVNQSVAQIADLLFPTDDKNYGISATPNPQIEGDLKDSSPAQVEGGGQVMDAETGEPISTAEVAARAQTIAKEKAISMEREIDDQLVQCDHASVARKALHWAGIFGSAIIAGPEQFTTTRHKMTMKADDAGVKKPKVTYEPQTSSAPRTRAVAPWDFYPDLSGSTIEESEFIFERSYMTRKQMRGLVKRKNYIKDNVKKVLLEETKTIEFASNGHVNALRRLTGGTDQTVDNRYEVWTYHGPISKDALREAGVKIKKDDPLDEFDGVVVFCGGFVLKAVLNPLESEDWPYSMWNWAVDDFCPFGFGVPWLCRNEQAIVNTAWRMMLDNSSKSAGPQIVAKRHAITPADGTETISPWKLWYADESISDVRSAFSVMSFPSVQQEVGNILTMARNFLTETAGLPPQVGQGAGQAPSTLGGMAMMMNASNTDRRRQVRDWDDSVTKPLITRFYYWNMQYHKDESIKGDYEVHARGTSALLLREQQAINLMAVLDKYAAHPALADSLKAQATLRKVIQAMHIAPDDLIKTDAEMEAEQAAMQEQPPEEDPMITLEQMRTEQIAQRHENTQQIEQLKFSLESQNNEADRQLRRDLAKLELEKQDRILQMEALKLSQTNDIGYQKILADLKKSRWKLNLDDSKFNKEMEIKKQDGNTANYGLE